MKARLSTPQTCWNRLLAAGSLVIWLGAGFAPAAPAGEIGFEESFALSDDRSKALEQLIPGTKDYYFYHCLDAQNKGRFDEVDSLLKAWVDRHGRTARVVEIENRQALFRYDTAPRESLDFIRKRLNVKLDHQRQVPGGKPELPTRLDPETIRRVTLARRALERHRGTLDGFEDRALEWALRLDLDPDRRRNLLGRLQRPDVPDLPRLVVADLGHKGSRGFGSLGIHKRMLLAQLKECLKLKPDLRNQANFVNVYLTKLWPSPDIDWRNDPRARQAYLERLWSFVSTLNASHNSLKAHVLYHRLAHGRATGTYDKALFLAYLRLPRNAPYVSRDYLRRSENRRFSANLGVDYRAVTLLPAVGNDEPLVRRCLAHFFLTETDPKPYTAYLDDRYVKELFAETKIVNGLGNMETWYSMLPPAKYQALKERVDLDFAATDKRVFAADESVGLDVYVKGVKQLIVKVFEINTLNYYRENLREVDTAVDLDGLVANEEKTYTYEEPALRRVKRHFEFPSLDRRGTYVVEFIGGGRSSRALIRKGGLHFFVRTGIAGHVCTVLDDANRKVPSASLWISGRRYAPDEDGLITVPFTAKPGRRPAIIVDGSFASLQFLDHESENYRLSAGIHVERESLLPRAKASVAIRPTLTVNGTPVTLSVLDDVELRITSTDRAGVTSMQVVKGFALHEDRESVHEFQVPANLARIQFVLKARVKNLSRNKKEDLRVERSFTLNGIDATEKIEDLHLVHAAGAYFLDLLGKTGEIEPDRAVAVTLKHRDFRDPVDAALKTDPGGRVMLGKLEDIEWVRAKGPEGAQHTWVLDGDRAGYPQSLHGRAGEVLHLPYTGSASRALREELSLLEVRGSTYVRDRFNALSVRDGYVEIGDLPAGDYDLFLKREGRRITVRLADGEKAVGYVLGRYRSLEAGRSKPLQIASVDVGDDTLKVKLRGTSKFARVHVFASRYEPEYDAWSDLAAVSLPAPYVVKTPGVESLYVVGRDIGDEQRYILERKYAKIYPGNLLTRPSLLLQPWAVRSTETGTQTARKGGAYDSARPASAPGAARGGRRAGRKAGAGKAGGFSSLDFLDEPAAVLLNLRPDADGVVTIERAKLGTHQDVTIVAVSPVETVSRDVCLAEGDTKFKDLRLLDSLDASKHYTEQKNVSLIARGKSFTLEDITTSDFEVYDTIGKAYRLLATLSGNATLAEFEFVTRWPELDPKEKRARYAKYACHELNFFLYRKDPKFFREVVRPYVQNKYHKTFLDHWLLGDDLAEYLEPWAFERLNIVERILLGRRIAKERAGMTRHVRDLLDLITPDMDRLDVLFRTALKGRALEGADDFGLAEARKEIRSRRAEDRDEAVEAESAVESLELAKAAPRRRSLSRKAAAAVAEKAVDKKAKAPRRAAPAEVTADGLSGYFAADRSRRRQVRQLYRKLEKTKEWAENNYYHLPIERQGASLVSVNPFWSDFAAHGGDGPFTSTHLAEASRSFPEMMLALSVLDLPFKAGKHSSKVEKASFRLEAAGPMVVYHKQIQEAPSPGEKASILVTQHYYRLGDRYIHVGNERRDKFITDEFLVHVVYGCHVVITNPTSSPQKLEVLLQVPRGSLPVKGGQYTRSLYVRLEPYRTWTADYFFYFPASGTMPHFPVHVAHGGKLLACAPPAKLKVLRHPSKVDTTSWDYVSQEGTGDQVLEYLAAHNLGRVRLERIAWRMRDGAFFRKVLALLESRHAYNGTLWAYGFLHNATGAVREYLRHADGFVRQCGAAIDTKLLTIDPVERRSYQHLEYWPLVNARAHRLGKSRVILNNRFFEQYGRLTRILAYRPKLDDGDLMSVACYLLLQDRVEDALKFFKRVRPGNLAAKLQYDYCDAYLALSTEDLRRARLTAERYAEYPVERWRAFFRNVLAQLDEIEGKAAAVVDEKDRTQAQTRLAATEPSFELELEGGKVVLSYQNLEKCRVNYYLMDIELLFSRSPFVGQYSGRFSYIRPNETAEISLDPKAAKHVFEIPRKFLSRNVLVEIVGAGEKKAKTHLSGAMAVQVIENYAQLRVTDAGAHKPLPRVYVKVYARMKGGRVRFYKDGYTDLRGRFDYGSLSTNELDNVDRFAILVLSPEQGAVVREAAPPSR